MTSIPFCIYFLHSSSNKIQRHPPFLPKSSHGQQTSWLVSEWALLDTSSWATRRGNGSFSCVLYTFPSIFLFSLGKIDGYGYYQSMLKVVSYSSSLISDMMAVTSGTHAISQHVKKLCPVIDRHAADYFCWLMTLFWVEDIGKSEVSGVGSKY